jgi:hypothetical protein
MWRATLPAAALCLLIPGAALTGELKEFASAEGKFKILLPGKPEEGTVKAGKTLVKTFTLKTDEGTYRIAYAEVKLPPDEPEEKTQQRLDGVLASMVKDAKAKATKQGRIKLADKHLGRLIEAEQTDGKGLMRGRIYLVGGRLYQIMLVGAPALVSSDQTSKFLNSFAVTP